MSQPRKFHIKENHARVLEDDAGWLVRTLCEHLKSVERVGTRETYRRWVKEDRLDPDPLCAL